jgi:amidase
VSVFVEQFSMGSASSGLKVAVKDTIDVAGYPSKAGSRALENASSAASHAEVVERILAAGCQLTGKLAMHELAYGMTGVNDWSGTPVNYHFPEYIPGGSSSGSAVAVARRDVDFSLGTDTGGSVRMPAACCGVYGLKPTFNRISRKGVMPAKTTLDCVGPFANSVEGLIEAMVIIDKSFEAVTNIGSITLGYVGTEAINEIQTAVDELLDKVVMDTIPVTLPLMGAAFEAGLTLINAEANTAYSNLDQTKLGEDVAKRLLAAKQTSQEAIDAAEEVRAQFTREVDEALLKTPILVLPTLPSFPMTVADAKAGKQDLSISSLVRPFNVSGHPAISIPIKEANGRPVSLQLVAAKWQDELLCEVARQISKHV